MAGLCVAHWGAPPFSVIPAEAGLYWRRQRSEGLGQCFVGGSGSNRWFWPCGDVEWIPAFAGMTEVRVRDDGGGVWDCRCRWWRGRPAVAAGGEIGFFVEGGGALDESVADAC